MRTYEELFIVKPDATDEEVNPLVDQLTGVITKGGGEIQKTDKWGRKRLAYRVDKYDEGQYILMAFTASPESVREIERRLRVADTVIKFITVRTDEMLKKLDKRQKVRAKRAARKPPPPVAMPSAAPSTPSAPGSHAAPGAPAMPAAAAPATPAPAPASVAPEAPAEPESQDKKAEA